MARISKWVGLRAFEVVKASKEQFGTFTEKEVGNISDLFVIDFENPSARRCRSIMKSRAL